MRIGDVYDISPRYTGLDWLSTSRRITTITETDVWYALLNDRFDDCTHETIVRVRRAIRDKEWVLRYPPGIQLPQGA